MVATTLSEAIDLLNKAKCTKDIQHAMNCIDIPEKDGNMDSPEFLPFKVPLKNAIQKVLTTMESLLNKQIRRRINRLLFVLATKEEKDLLKTKTESPKNISTATNRIASNTKVESKPEVILKPDEIKAPPISPTILKDFLTELERISSSEELLGFLERFSSNCPGEDETKAKLREKFEIFLGDPSIGNNARTRRRIKRAIDSLSESQTSAAVPTNIPQGTLPQSIKADPEKKLLPAPAEKEEAALEWVPIPDELIHQVAQCQSATDLTTALSALRPASGTCKSRRTLKRAIEKALTKEEIQTALCARTRRKITRALQLLEPHNGAHRDQPLTPSKTAEESQKKLNDKAAAAAAASITSKKNPYVVFISQLPYSATAEEISQHLEKHGVEGPIKVRLLTDPATGGSRGMAFADLSDAQQLHKSLALHHSLFGGRLINVEKSCGGKSATTRGEKLAQRRAEQRSKVLESIHALWAEAKEKGFFTVDLDHVSPVFREKLYAFSPTIVGKVLKKLSSTFSAEESSTDGKKISLMDKMLTRIVKKRRSNTEGVAGGDGAENNNDDDDDGRHSVNDNNKDFDVEITDEESS